MSCAYDHPFERPAGIGAVPFYLAAPQPDHAGVTWLPQETPDWLEEHRQDVTAVYVDRRGTPIVGFPEAVWGIAATTDGVEFHARWQDERTLRDRYQALWPHLVPIDYP